MDGVINCGLFKTTGRLETSALCYFFDVAPAHANLVISPNRQNYFIELYMIGLVIIYNILTFCFSEKIRPADG